MPTFKEVSDIRKVNGRWEATMTFVVNTAKRSTKYQVTCHSTKPIFSEAKNEIKAALDEAAMQEYAKPGKHKQTGRIPRQEFIKHVLFAKKYPYCQTCNYAPLTSPVDNANITKKQGSNTFYVSLYTDLLDNKFRQNGPVYTANHIASIEETRQKALALYFRTLRDLHNKSFGDMWALLQTELTEDDLVFIYPEYNKQDIKTQLHDLYHQLPPFDRHNIKKQKGKHIGGSSKSQNGKYIPQVSTASLKRIFSREILAGDSDTLNKLATIKWSKYLLKPCDKKAETQGALDAELIRIANEADVDNSIISDHLNGQYSAHDLERIRATPSRLSQIGQASIKNHPKCIILEKSTDGTAYRYKFTIEVSASATNQHDYSTFSKIFTSVEDAIVAHDHAAMYFYAGQNAVLQKILARPELINSEPYQQASNTKPKIRKRAKKSLEDVHGITYARLYSSSHPAPFVLIPKRLRLAEHQPNPSWNKRIFFNTEDDAMAGADFMQRKYYEEYQLPRKGNVSARIIFFNGINKPTPEDIAETSENKDSIGDIGVRQWRVYLTVTCETISSLSRDSSNKWQARYRLTIGKRTRIANRKEAQREVTISNKATPEEVRTAYFEWAVQTIVDLKTTLGYRLHISIEQFIKAICVMSIKKFEEDYPDLWEKLKLLNTIRSVALLQKVALHNAAEADAAPNWQGRYRLSFDVSHWPDDTAQNIKIKVKVTGKGSLKEAEKALVAEIVRIGLAIKKQFTDCFEMSAEHFARSVLLPLFPGINFKKFKQNYPSEWERLENGLDIISAIHLETPLTLPPTGGRWGASYVLRDEVPNWPKTSTEKPHVIKIENAISNEALISTFVNQACTWVLQHKIKLGKRLQLSAEQFVARVFPMVKDFKTTYPILWDTLEARLNLSITSIQFEIEGPKQLADGQWLIACTWTAANLTETTTETFQTCEETVDEANIKHHKKLVKAPKKFKKKGAGLLMTPETYVAAAFPHIPNFKEAYPQDWETISKELTIDKPTQKPAARPTNTDDVPPAKVARREGEQESPAGTSYQASASFHAPRTSTAQRRPTQTQEMPMNEAVKRMRRR